MLDIAKPLSASTSVHALTGSSRPGAVPPLVPLGSIAAEPTVWGHPGPNPAIRDLVEEFEAKHAEATALSTAAGDIDCDKVPGWPALAARLDEISDAMYEIRAESMADVLLVSRFLHIPWVRDDKQKAADLGYNLAEDLLRISGGLKTGDAAETPLSHRDDWRRRLAPLIRRADSVSRACCPVNSGQDDVVRNLRRKKLRGHMRRRVGRWARRLMSEPAHDARSLGIKADVYLELVAAGWTGDRDAWTSKFAIRLAQDAARLGVAQGFDDPAAAMVDLLGARHPDAELVRLGRAWQECADRHEQAIVARDEAEERLGPTVWPKALFFDEETDPPVLGAYGRLDAVTGRRWYGDRGTIARLRSPWLYGDLGLARRDAILAAYDAHVAQRAADADAAGVTVAQDVLDRTREENEALRRRILAIPAKTHEGVMVKVTLACWCLGDVAGMEVDHSTHLRTGDIGDEAFSCGALLDIARVLQARGSVAPRPEEPLGDVNLVPVPLTGLSVGRYPAGSSREVVESYRTFLLMELRFLNHEVYGRDEDGLHYWMNTPAGRFHGGDHAPASSRAAAVLGLLGLLPDDGADGMPLPEASAA